jgi:hypothetical protein
VHKTLRCRPIDRLLEERAVMAPLPQAGPDVDRRWVIRVPPDPYLRFDTCDYSLDPRLVGRQVEARVTEREVLAVALDTGHRGAPNTGPRRASRGRPSPRCLLFDTSSPAPQNNLTPLHDADHPTILGVRKHRPDLRRPGPADGRTDRRSRTRGHRDRRPDRPDPEVVRWKPMRSRSSRSS